MNINNNFLKLQDNYLFSKINMKVNDYIKENPKAHIIRLGIGDVTRPISKVVIEAIKKAADEMGREESFRGYGPEQGYEFLRNIIVENDYKNLGIEKDEVFISDGSKCDTGNFIEVFEKGINVAIPNPVYPVYLDTNIMYGNNIIYMNLCEEKNFEPIPEELLEVPDLIYICSPNNPTGVGMRKDLLKKWVDYASKNNSIILFDAAYEAYISQNDIPHSIYEIEGAKKVAVEFRSFSKTAGFTGLRCAYTIVPKEINCKGNCLNKLWNRRHSTKFNGVSYIIQRGAEAVYSEEGKKEVNKNIKYYMENAKIIKDRLDNLEIKSYGGINSPYIWLKIPKEMKSWDFFDLLLEKYNIVGTPGVGFGTKGEGYFRLTSFGKRENIIEAMERLK